MRMIVLNVVSLSFLILLTACTQDEYLFPEIELGFDDTFSFSAVVDPQKQPYRIWTTSDVIYVNDFSSLSFYHQSAAAYGDYAFFVTSGRGQICMFSLAKKEKLFTLNLKGVNSNTYHCNQSTFGYEKYDELDSFPLLYISQRAKSDGRCFIEAFRIFPQYNEDLSEIESFNLELVQTIYLPAMNYGNSLGNANCAIDAENRMMYTYSRNNNSKEDNFGQCKISQFAIPSVHEETVYLEDDDIISSFTLDASAVNMQGGCIKDGILYIGQGYPSAEDFYLNIIDLEKQELVSRIDLHEYRVGWEPEGCFFYDGSVMLTHTGAICRIDK